jgi:hypothetical protein
MTLKDVIPQLTRSSLHRCLQGHGISRLPKVDREKPKKFKALKFRTPYEAIKELWKSKPDVFIAKPNHHMLGPNT